MNWDTSNPAYEEIGIQTIINAGGTKSTHGGSRISSEVLEAMNLASTSFVDVLELNRKVGEYIAQITGAESGMVTNGASSGVVLSLAACMTGTNISKIRRLPNTDGMKNEMVIQKIHQGGYSHMYSFTGAKIIDVGNINDCLPEELDAAINEKTAAVAYLFGPRISKVGLTLPEVVEIAHSKNVPVIVDAAAMLPPKVNLRRYINEGADLVVFSGGKFIQAPQATGLLFGKKELVEAALLNASPNHSIGRPYKVSRESIVGLYKALQIYMKLDENKLFDKYYKQLAPMVDSLRTLTGIEVSIQHDDVNYNVPTLVIQFSSNWKGKTPNEILKAMIKGDPPIFMQYFKGLSHLTVSPINLQSGEEKIITKRLMEVLKY